jgi:hypothetical protein
MPHARRATPCSSEARVGGDRHPPGHLRLLHNPAGDGSGVPAHRPRPLRRGCRPGPRRLLAPGRPDRSRRGTGRVLPRRPQHPGGKLGERSEGRRHRTARHAPDDERRRYRAHQGRGGAGVGPGAHVYAAMRLPFRPESVGSLRRAGSEVGTEEVIDAFAVEATHRYGAVRVPLDGRTLALACSSGGAHLVGT